MSSQQNIDHMRRDIWTFVLTEFQAISRVRMNLVSLTNLKIPGLLDAFKVWSVFYRNVISVDLYFFEP